MLGHELTHVVQQRQGRVKANVPDASLPINDDPSLEAEADHYGSLAAAGTMTDGTGTDGTGTDASGSVSSPIIQGTWDEALKDARRMWGKHVDKTNNLHNGTVNELFDNVDYLTSNDKVRFSYSLHSKISDIFSVTGGNYTELEEAQRLLGEEITPFFGQDEDNDPDIDYSQENDNDERVHMMDEDEEDSNVLLVEKRVAMEIKTISSHDDLQINARIHEAIGQLDKRRDTGQYDEYVIVIQKYHPENPWPYTKMENRAAAELSQAKGYSKIGEHDQSAQL
ncbi:hypothetical protein [Brevibacillus formosus]|uniref:hypothetical protein n=1 Tax=Brevibacillus formosus TaxID=54913 RepID=UPI001F19BF00|nr:hypothetical protein [Brevibacillus formosus]